MAELNIYEVIFGEGDGEPDTIYIVTAYSHIEAVALAERAPQFGRGAAGLHTKADAVSKIGESRITSAEPQILRGPFRETGYTRGETWLYDSEHKKWFNSEDYCKPRGTPAVPKDPLKPADFNTAGETFTCPACGGVFSTRQFFTLTATGRTEKGNKGGYGPSDLVLLDLWHVLNSEARLSRKLELAQKKYDYDANVVCCSAQCLKTYLCKAVDKLTELPV